MYPISPSKFVCYLWRKSAIPPHPKGALLDRDLVTVEVIGVLWTYWHLPETSLRWWGLWHGALSCWKQPSEDGSSVVIKGWTLSKTILAEAAAIKWCWSSTKGRKTCQEHTPTPLQHHQHWHQEGWIHDFILTMSHCDPNSKINLCQMRQHCFNLQLSNLSESVWTVHTFLFSTVTPSVVFYCCSPPSSRLNVLCLQPWCSASSFWTDLCKC